MSTECEKCRGDGLVGAGEQPWLKQGAISTCPECSGKGQLADVTPEVPVESTEPAPEVQPE